MNKNTTLAKILSHEKGEEILAKYNVPCLGCAFAQQEMDHITIGEIGEKYGIDVDGILRELNEK